MIHIDSLLKTIGTRNLLTINRLHIHANEKIGLIGNNGEGKTTFLKILAGRDNDYEGYIQRKIKINCWLGNSDIEWKSSRDYSNEDEIVRNTLSPGEYQWLRISRLLRDRQSFLLMDEPTTYLDMPRKETLMKELKKRNVGFLLASHDRNFIAKTCTKIFELSHGELEVFNGDYFFYLEEKRKRQKFIQREYDTYISEKRRLTNLAQRIKVQSMKIQTTPKRMGNSEARLHKMGGQQNKKKLDKQAKAVTSRLDRLEVKCKPQEEKLIRLTVGENKKIHAKILLKAEDLSKHFDNQMIFNKAKFEIENGSKVALLGENGSGKTTLLQMIFNQEVWTHPLLKIGYYSQLNESLNLAQTILTNVRETSIYDQTMTRRVLARLGFKTEDLSKKVEILSEGEKAKVKLAKLLTSDFNYLIMDEPTNKLDMRSLEALEDLLTGYDRPLLFVTHDSAFVNRIADTLLIIEEQKILKFKGNWKQYEDKNKSLESNPLDFRLIAISNRISEVTSEYERQQLLKEYERLMKQKLEK